MKKLTQKEIKQVILEILVYFHKFCEENNLKYYLAYGTLLGAIRHKGFIPWDDDIDVYMPREDYERLLKIFYAKNIKLISIYNEPKFYVPFIKLVSRKTSVIENITDKFKIGLWIDIFSLDNIANSYTKTLLLYHRVKFLRILYEHKNCEYHLWTNNFWHFIRSSVHKAINFLVFFISKKYLLIRIDKLSQKYKNKINSKYIGHVASIYKNFVLEREWFEEKVLLDFEGYKFWAPKEWDKVLKNNYGNYMKLPSEDKRRTHLIEAYWK